MEGEALLNDASGKIVGTEGRKVSVACEAVDGGQSPAERRLRCVRRRASAAGVILTRCSCLVARPNLTVEAALTATRAGLFLVFPFPLLSSQPAIGVILHLPLHLLAATIPSAFCPSDASCPPFSALSCSHHAV